MTIKEVEERLDITRANVRFYEKEGLLITRRNAINGYREYSEENIDALKKIIFLRNLDVSIEDIRNVQINKLTMEELLSKYNEILKEKAKAYEASRLTCLEMIKNSEYHYSNLDVDKYQKQNGRHDYLLIKDTISNLSAIKDKIVIWVLILLSFIISMIACPLLPEYILVQGSGAGSEAEIWRGFIFLFPLASVLVVFLARVVVWNILYLNIPFYLIYADSVTMYVNLCSIIIITTCQFHTIFFLNEIGLSLSVIILSEIIIFLSFVITSVLVKSYKYKKGEYRCI